MTTFLLYMFSPVIVAFFYNLIKKKSINTVENKKMYLYILGFIMFFMIGFRYYGNGSGDSYFYYSNWERMSKVPFFSLFDTIRSIDLESGYLLSIWLLSNIFKPPQFVFIFSGLFISVSVCLFVYRNCKDVVLSLVIFNCLGLFSFMVQGLRQSLAMCICLYSIEMCKKRKLKSFLFLIFLAMQFHGSAIVFLIVYFLYYLKFDIKGMGLFIIGVGSVYIFLPYLFLLVNYYISDNYINNRGMNDGTGIVPIAIYVTIILTSIVLRKKNVKKTDVESRNYYFFFYISCVGLITLIMRNSISGIAERVSYYFAFGQMVIVSSSINNMDKYSRTLIKPIIILLSFGVAIYKASYTVLVPYLFFWQ